MDACHYLACDLGAESGRLMRGSIEDGRLALEELHRFPNTPLQENGSLVWNMPALFAQLEEGMRKAASSSVAPSSISTDSWGVDYLLYDEAGELISPSYHYRDSRSARGVKSACSRLTWAQIFNESGVQFMPFNTLFQLAAEAPERLARARRILGVGDGFNYWLSGVARFEESLASTTQLYDPRVHTWSARLIEALQLPAGIFPPIVPSGTVLGPLRKALGDSTRLRELQVIASCSHDTAAAVAAVPASDGSWAYLSSGTWSLMGVEIPEPILTEACRELNFTNEIGFGGSVRLLKNIIGLWLVQECRREWVRAGSDCDYPTLMRLANEATPFRSIVNPADDRFLAPGEMPAKIASFCRERGQQVPDSPGATIRCALESLALLYGRTLRQIERLLGRRIERLHIVGGGSKNTLLNQFTANSLQIPVVAGPAEATAAGNILVQAIALGRLPSLGAARQVVRDSFATEVFEPAQSEEWVAAADRFERFFV